MVSAAATDLHSFRLAHPVMRVTGRFDATALGILSLVAFAVWLLVIPAEFALHLTV